MTHRTVIRFFCGSMLAALSLGCGGDVPTGSPSAGLLAVDPLFAGVKKGATQQLTATLNGTAVAVTWTTSNQAVATVSSTGLVTAVAAGQASITASVPGDATQQRPASITVTP
jgi:hypothetical protein